jgi:hypothetical protein
MCTRRHGSVLAGYRRSSVGGKSCCKKQNYTKLSNHDAMFSVAFVRTHRSAQNVGNRWWPPLQVTVHEFHSLERTQ